MTFNLAPNLKLPEESVTQTFGILGRRGSGKTNLAVCMAEEMLSSANSIVWIDPIGVAWGLRSDYGIMIAGGDNHPDIPLEPTGGKLMAEFLMESRVSCILDVSGFGEGEMRRFVADFGARFYQLGKKKRHAVHVFIDEADTFAPQSTMSGDAAKSLGAIQNLVCRGRAGGIGVTLISQRSAAIAKSVFTQTECLVAFQTTAPHDLKAIGDWIKYHGTPEECSKILSELPKLQRGECWVYSPAWLEILERTKIRARRTFDSSDTPKAGQVRTQPKHLADIDLAALTAQMSETMQKVQENDPKILRARIAELENGATAVDVDKLKQTNELLRDALKHSNMMVEKLMIRLVDVQRCADAPFADLAEWGDTPSEFVQILESESKPRTSEEIGKSLFVDPADWGRSFEAMAIREGRDPDQELVRVEKQFLDNLPSRHPAASTMVYQSARREGKTAAANGEAMGPISPNGPTGRILDSIAWWESIGLNSPNLTQVAFVAKYSARGGSFNTYISRIVKDGLIDRAQGVVMLTPAGRRLAAFPDGEIATLREFHSRIIETVKEGPLVKILNSIIGSRSRQFTIHEIANMTGYEAGGGSFNTYLSRLVTWGLITRKSGIVKPTEILFPAGLK